MAVPWRQHVLFAKYDLKDGVRSRRVRVGGRCTGRAQSVAALDEARHVVHVVYSVLSQTDNLDSLTTIFHNSQLLFVAE